MDLALSILGGGGPVSKLLGKKISEILVTLLLPAVTKIQDAADRIEQTQQNLHLAFALAAYRADKGSYPEKLEALTPAYLPRVPDDLFSGGALIYQPTKDGFLLYSVGVNGRDEQGLGYEDEPRGDDLNVRIPVPAPKKKE
jgi:type II secretory pathway pseudopilin PulG